MRRITLPYEVYSNMVTSYEEKYKVLIEMEDKTSSEYIELKGYLRGLNDTLKILTKNNFI